MKKLLAALLAAGTMALAVPAAQAAEPYKMTPGDQLQVVVYGHADLSSSTAQTPYIVRPDGKISFPLVGEMDTTGLTLDQFQAKLTEAYSEYIVNPQIALNIVKLGTTRVYVLGQVKQPGMFELEKSHRVLDALGAAHGFTDKAAKKNIFLVRAGSNKAERLDINAYLRSGDQKYNMELQEGDSLYITSNHKFNMLTFVSQLSSALNNIDEMERRK